MIKFFRDISQSLIMKNQTVCHSDRSGGISFKILEISRQARNDNNL